MTAINLVYDHFAPSTATTIDTGKSLGKQIAETASIIQQQQTTEKDKKKKDKK